MKRLVIITIVIFTALTVYSQQDFNLRIKTGLKDTTVNRYSALYPELFERAQKSSVAMYYADSVEYYKYLSGTWMPYKRIVYLQYEDQLWTRREIQQYTGGQWSDSLLETRTFDGELLQTYLTYSEIYNDTVEFYRFDDTSLVEYVSKVFASGDFIGGTKYVKNINSDYLPLEELVYRYTSALENHLEAYVKYNYSDEKLQNICFYSLIDGDLTQTAQTDYFYTDEKPFYDSLVQSYLTDTGLTALYARKTTDYDDEGIISFVDWIYYQAWLKYSQTTVTPTQKLTLIFDSQTSQWVDTLYYERKNDDGNTVLMLKKSFYFPTPDLKSASRFTYEYSDCGLTLSLLESFDVHTRQWYNVSKTGQLYNSDCNILETVNLMWNRDSNAWDSIFRVVYTYDGENLDSQLTYTYSTGWIPSIKIKYYGHTVEINTFTPQITRINIYPNPATDWLYIDAPADGEMQIFSLDGKSLIKTANTGKIYVGSLSPGIYLVRIGNATEKFVKR